MLTIGAQRGPDLGRRAAPTQSPTHCGVSAQRPWPAGSCPSGELSICRPPTSPALPHTFAQARPFRGTLSSAQGGSLRGLEGLEKASKPRVSLQSLRVGPGALLGDQQRFGALVPAPQPPLGSAVTDKRGETLGGPWKPGACACIRTDLSSLHSLLTGGLRGAQSGRFPPRATQTPGLPVGVLGSSGRGGGSPCSRRRSWLPGRV